MDCGSKPAMTEWLGCALSSGVIPGLTRDPSVVRMAERIVLVIGLRVGARNDGVVTVPRSEGVIPALRLDLPLNSEAEVEETLDGIRVGARDDGGEKVRSLSRGVIPGSFHRRHPGLFPQASSRA